MEAMRDPGGFPTWAVADQAPQSPPKPGGLPRARGPAVGVPSQQPQPADGMRHRIAGGSPPTQPFVPRPVASTLSGISNGIATLSAPSAAEASAVSQIEQLRMKLEQYNRSIADAIGAVDAASTILSNSNGGEVRRDGTLSRSPLAGDQVLPGAAEARTLRGAGAAPLPFSPAVRTPDIARSLRPELSAAAIYSLSAAAAEPQRAAASAWDGDDGEPVLLRPASSGAAKSIIPASSSTASSTTTSPTLRKADPQVTTAEIGVRLSTTTASPTKNASELFGTGGQWRAAATVRVENPYNHQYLRNAMRRVLEAEDQRKSATSPAPPSGGKGDDDDDVCGGNFEEVEERDVDTDREGEEHPDGDALSRMHVELEIVSDEGERHSGEEGAIGEDEGEGGSQADDADAAFRQFELHQQGQSLGGGGEASADSSYEEAFTPTFDMAERALHELSVAQRSAEVLRGLNAIPLKPAHLPFSDRLQYFEEQRAAALAEYAQLVRETKDQQLRHHIATEQQHADGDELAKLNALVVDIDAAKKNFKVVLERKADLLAKEMHLKERANAMQLLYAQLDERRRFLGRREAELVSRRARYTQRLADIAAREAQQQVLDDALARRESELREQERHYEKWICALEGREERTTEKEKRLHEQRTLLELHLSGAAQRPPANAATVAAAGKENRQHARPVVEMLDCNVAATTAAAVLRREPVASAALREHESIVRDDDDDDGEEDGSEEHGPAAAPV